MKRLLTWLSVQPAAPLTSLLVTLMTVASFALESNAAEKKNILSAGEWEFRIEPDDQLFPSLCIATATAKAPATTKNPSSSPSPGKLRLVSIRLSSPTDNCQVRAVITAKGLMEESVAQQTLKSAGNTYVIAPDILWDFTALARIRQPQPANVTVELFADGKSLGKKTKVIKVRSINDCPFAFLTDKGPIPAHWMFAAYVNEDHPWVDSILKSALASKQVASFSGYQSGGPQQVYQQVFAVWNVMQRSGLKYSSITRTSSQSSKVASQHVRFLDETVRNAQANCVDGSVLFASVLRKIDIEPFLVLVPGHCFVGFWLDREKKSGYACLETTMMGAVDLGNYGKDGGLGQMFGLATKSQASWRTFSAAVDAGNKRFSADKEKLTTNAPGFMIVDINWARTIGITPIAYEAGSTKQ